MPRFEGVRLRLGAVDWLGWIALAWALWFGWLYGRMVVETQGRKVRTFLGTGLNSRSSTDALAPWASR
jgi:hypothetical protein